MDLNIFIDIIKHYNYDREKIIKDLDKVLEEEKEKEKKRIEKEEKKKLEEKKSKLKNIKSIINNKINTFKNINHFVFLIDNDFIEGIDEIIPKRDNLNLCIFNGRTIKFFSKDEKWRDYILAKHKNIYDIPGSSLGRDSNITLVNNEYVFTIDEIYSNKFFEEVEKTHFDYLRENEFIKDDSDDDYDMSKMYEDNGIEW